MRHLLNTLFVTSENVYLSLDGENVVATVGKQEAARYPLHTLENIITFSYAGATPALMGACARRGIGLSFCSQSGAFLARIAGIHNGNVLLRREQYRIADNMDRSCIVARNMILGKAYNCRWVLERALRDHGTRIESEKVNNAINIIKTEMKKLPSIECLDSLRGSEGVIASAYFQTMDHLILRDKDHFFLRERNRRPPLDNVNAMLSFAYTLLGSDCANALESVGIDSYVGFMHRDKPGRASLSLDLMEELRPCVADRFVISSINNRVVQADDFEVQEQGAVRLTKEGKKKFLGAWQERKKERIKHPFLDEKVPWGLVPYLQALLLARNIRGDLDGYPPFLWK